MATFNEQDKIVFTGTQMLPEYEGHIGGLGGLPAEVREKLEADTLAKTAGLEGIVATRFANPRQNPKQPTARYVRTYEVTYPALKAKGLPHKFVFHANQMAHA